MAATPAVVVNEGPPMKEVKNIFFKAYNPLNYYVDEADADAVQNDTAFQYFNRGLEVSDKYGCLILSFDNSLFVLRIKDILPALKNSNNDSVSFGDSKKLKVLNNSLPVTPNILALSTGEEFLAVDTVRGDSSWVVIFKLDEFLNQGGSCIPFCEIRCSSSSNSRISSVCWNPGETMTNLLAINVDDGALFLAKVVGQNNVELTRFADGGVRSLCWSPKGKQLVIGRMNGNLSQLKLDLSLAKEIPSPGPGSVPISILWTQTTQFLIVFQRESSIDFMQLDLPKGASPIYTNSGDIFISDNLPAKCSCFFLNFMPWNTVMAMTNSASDVVVLVKEAQNNGSELWIPGDVADNRRAAFQLDNYARGAAVYHGSQDPVVFSEVETYPPMPIIFLLSQRGSLSVYSIVNGNREAQSLKVETTASLPDSLFSNLHAQSALKTLQAPQSQNAPQQGVQQQQTLMPKPLASNFSPQVPTSTFFQPPQPTSGSLIQSPFKFPQPTGAIPTSTFNPNPSSQTLPASQQISPPKPQQPVASVPQQQLPKQPVPNQQFGQKLGGLAPSIPTDPRQLGTSTLPTPKDMAGLQKAVEEKRREMTTQLHKGAELKGLEEDDRCAFVISEVRKFEQSLADFIAGVTSNRINLSGILNTSFSAVEKSVLSTLNVVEDFASDMESTTNAQKEEVEILKERILNHFSQLEYAKSLVDRSRDPRYLEHLRSRPLDPASQQKFEDVSKMHNYITNQIAECRGFFYEQSRKRDTGIDRASYSQLIYLTLSNHSKIIRRLKAELDCIKERLGLGKHTDAFDDAEYLAVCEPSHAASRKSLPPSGLNESQPSDITLNDLTAGISKVKLNQDSDRPDRKPIKFSNRKLLILKTCTSRVSVIKVKVDEASWTREPSKSTRPKPLEHPSTSSLEPSASNIVQPDIKSEVHASPTPSATFPMKDTLSIGSEPSCLTPDNSRHESFGSASGYPSMMKPSLTSFGASFSSLAGSNSDKSVGVPAASSLPSAAPNPASILKSFSPQGTSNSTATKFTSQFSPSTQSPTLAGLLSSPPVSSPSSTSFVKPIASATSTMPTGFTSNTLSFSSGTNTAFTSAPSFFSVGSGAFSFGAQQNVTPKETAASVPAGTSTTTVTPSFPSFSIGSTLSVTTSGVSTSAPSSALFSFGSSLVKPTTTTVSVPVPSTITTSSASPGGISISAGIPKAQTPLPPPQGSEALNLSSSASGNNSNTTMTKSTTIASPGVFSFTSPNVSTSATTSEPNVGLSFGVPGSTGKGTTTVTTSGGGIFSGSPILFGSSAGGTSIFGAPGNVVISKPTVVTTSVSPLTVTAVAGNASSPGLSTTSVPVVTASPTNVAATTTLASSVEPVITTSVATSAPGFGLATSAPVVTTSSTGLFSAPFGGSATNTSSTSIFGGGGLSFGTPASSASGGLFGAVTSASAATTTATTTTATTTTPSLFGVTPSTTGGLFSASTVPTSGLFSAAVATSTTVPTSGLFSATATTVPTSGLFSATATTVPTSGLFSAAVATTTTPSTTSSTGLFGSGSAGLFSSPQTTASTTTPSAGFMSSLSISDSANKSATPASTGAGGLFSVSAFGTTTPSPSVGSIFGGGNSTTFGSQQPSATGAFGAGATSQSGFGVFGQNKAATTSAGVFGSPTTATANPVFGGSAAFGTTSPFGSSFGGASASTTFGSTGGSIFGSPATSTNQTAGFGALAQQGTTTSAFGGGSPFGGNSQPQQSQGSLFGSPSQQKTGLFSSTFGSPTSTSSGSIFGGGSGSGSLFGQSGTGASGPFSSGITAGGVAQQGFGFAQAKSPTGSTFGSPPAAAPVFGGGATFGSTSPFGSSFAAPTGSTFGSGGSVFGGATASTPTAGFGALAQQSSTSPGFGGSTGFGSAPAQPQQPSLFGSPTPQQQSKPVFGGQAFSSWR